MTVELAMLSIGALSKATGIPTETLRTWERRYGFPNPDRSPSGHRVYRPEAVEHLLWVSKALEGGHRPSNVLKLSLLELKKLCGDTGVVGPYDEEPTVASDIASMRDEDVLELWFDAIRALDGNRFASSLRRVWNRVGTIAFLNDYVGPFLSTIGEAWGEGDLAVSHEHFASEHLADFLAGIWRPLARPAVGTPLVLTTLPGEDHLLGLHMAACIVTLAGWRVVFLGRNTPLADIINVTEQSNAPWVLLSVSIAMPENRARTLLGELREGLHGSREILVGGAGAPRDVDGIRLISDLPELSKWAFEERAHL